MKRKMMKNTKKTKSTVKPQKQKELSDKNEEEVAVIVDVKSGSEYYMFPVDFFKIERRSYVAMVPYEPVAARSKDAEVVILRSQVTKEGDQLYIAINDKKELKDAFEVFFKRFEEAEKKKIGQ